MTNNPNGWQVPEGGKITYLTDDELRRFFAVIRAIKNDVIRRRDLAMFHIILAYGLRCAEVPLINVTDFNDDGSSQTQLRVTRVKRKRDPKTGEPKPRLYRWYDVTPANTKLLRSWLEVRPTYHRAKENPALFLTFHSTADHAFSTAHIYDLVRDYGKAAGIAGIHPHQFRHTTAVKMAQAGMSAYDIQFQLGHTSILSGQTYVNRFGAERKALEAKIGKALEF